MIRMKFLTALFIGAFAYTFVSFVAGQNGIVSYNQLAEQKKEIAYRTNEIQNINNELKLEYTALLKDRDVIAAYARKLDYVSDGEKLVKITGLKPYQTTLFDIGSVVRRKECSCLPEDVCKIFGVSFFLVSFVLMLCVDLSRGSVSFRKKEFAVVEGIPVYDLQQI